MQIGSQARSTPRGSRRGIGSNNENSKSPAKNPPICACHATLPPSLPIAIEPTPKMGFSDIALQEIIEGKLSYELKPVEEAKE